MSASATSTESGTPNLDASIEQARAVADEAAGRLRETATTAADLVAQRAPGATAFSQQAISGVAERIDRSPEDALLLASVMTAGVWVGMVLSKVPRWLMLLALAPTAIVVLATLPRFATRRTRTKRR
ncbi:MAG: hypothetical protein U0667_09345 [Chloroflexota bacterium]